MQRPYFTFLFPVVAALSLAACAGNDKQPQLLNLRSATQGPDEFMVLPAKPLEEPASFAELPAPTPGGSNRTDLTPEADAVAALGGNPAALSRGGVENGIVSYASRYGRDAAIRSDLASADLEFRRQNDGRILERLLNVNVYFKAYTDLSLDQYAELERWRRKGLRTPAAPPPPAE